MHTIEERFVNRLDTMPHGVITTIGDYFIAQILTEAYRFFP